MSSQRLSTLRWRLLISLLLGTLLSWIIVAVLGYQSARQEIDALFDAELAGGARFLLDLSRDQLPHAAEVRRIMHAASRVHEYEIKFAVQIWGPQGRLLLRSAEIPELPLTTKDGFHEQSANDRRWRVFSLTDPDNGIRVQVAQNLDVRRQLGHDIAVIAWAPALVMLPLLGLLAWLVIGHAMRPLVRLTQELERREPGNLQPVPEGLAPGEVRPLVAALNALFLRLGQAFDNERRFTADAAHELRTPLAALQVHAQIAQRADNQAVRNEALNQLLLGVERATHLVEQLLTLARMDAACLPESPRLIDPCALIAEVLAALAPLAMARGIELQRTGACCSPLWITPGVLNILLRNLVDNALRYTPKGGRVGVHVEETGGVICLAVTDSGPGIPEAKYDQVFERFFRDNSGDGGGCGLGLSIVQRIAELYGTELKLGCSQWGGLRVEVCFGCPAAGTIKVLDLEKRIRN